MHTNVFSRSPPVATALCFVHVLLEDGLSGFSVQCVLIYVDNDTIHFSDAENQNGQCQTIVEEGIS